MQTRLGVLVNAEETVQKLHDMPLRAVDGKTALQIRKALNAVEAEVQSFRDARDTYVQQNGTEDANGNISIKDPHAQQEAQRYLNEMLLADVEITWSAPIDTKILDNLTPHVELVVRDLDVLEAIGLLDLESESAAS